MKTFSRKKETTTLTAPRAHGFSVAMIDQFFKPFFGGVFLEPDLQTSSRLFEYLFKLFASTCCLVYQGMERIPNLLLLLPADSIRLGTKAARLESTGLILETGERLSAKSIVVATEGPQAARFLSEIPRPSSRSVTCLYYAAEESPLNEPILALNGTGDGPINHCCVPSQVAPDYAPPGAALLSVTVLGKNQTKYYEPLKKRSGHSWPSGPQALGWKHLKTYHILNAVLATGAPHPSGLTRPGRISRGLYVCGDYLNTASINGAMVSGRVAAEDIEDLR
ncbi:MAG: FAD-dependent oxidoreductase [Terriglobia bacterium]